MSAEFFIGHMERLFICVQWFHKKCALSDFHKKLPGNKGYLMILKIGVLDFNEQRIPLITGGVHKVYSPKVFWGEFILIDFAHDLGFTNVFFCGINYFSHTIGRGFNNHRGIVWKRKKGSSPLNRK